MKRKSLILIAALLVVTLALSACAKPTTTVKVATDATFAPFEYTNDAGELVGFDVDLMNAIAEKAGFKFEWVNVPFDSVLAGLSECQYDAAIAAISISEDRKASMLFSAPYLDAGLVVVINKATTDIAGIDDLKGKTVAAQLGTTGEMAAQEIENVVYKPYDSYELAFLELANKGVDAVIADNPLAMGYIAANPEKIMAVGDILNNEQYGIAICNKNADLQTKIDKALKELIDSGYVAELASKYIK
ncbi:MAG: polar amino acid transport system substrate-binding protein [Chloroflexi bacterium]|nr:MAG: polar amino acid transport system substrate-binding protein [Chloroflexota bacterium]